MKIILLKITIFFFLILPMVLSGQSEAGSPNKIKANSISLGIVGAPAWPIGISYGQMLTDRFSFEMGAGIRSAGAGFNYYLTNPGIDRLNFHTGFFASINYDGFPMYYLPVGATYFAKNNLQYSADVGILSSNGVEGVTFSESSTNPSLWFGLKVGYRFGEDVATLNSKEKTSLKNIVSLNLGASDPYVGVYYERLLTPNFGAEAGVGILGASLGVKFYFPAIRNGRLNFHLGASQGYGYGEWKAYFPIGVNVLTNKNFRFSLDAGPQIWYDTNDITPSFSIRLGKAF
ncbi:MAG: hypothetical protein IH598_06660 [Bacteroidales bacterium]|nr:hypothetical protein [Bacteroidales bacterium]